MAIEPMRKGLRSALVWLWLAGLLWASGFVFSTRAAAQAEDVSAGEIQIKAAFLYKFTGYVEWPKSSFKDPDSPITIGVLGADEIADELRRIVSGRSVQNRGLTVAAINKENDLTGVHVLFIGREATARLPRLIEAARQRPILIVTDAADGLERGSIINFVMVKRRVQFEIAVEAAEKSGLTLSSRLLSVALRVKKGDIKPELYLAGLRAFVKPASICVGMAPRARFMRSHLRSAPRKEIQAVSFV